MKKIHKEHGYDYIYVPTYLYICVQVMKLNNPQTITEKISIAFAAVLLKLN